MSNRQRTLLGVKKTTESSDIIEFDNYLLLNQIEDDLDKFTIYNEILPLLEKTKNDGKQIFVVTHITNIGTLLEGNPIAIELRNDELKIKSYVLKITRE
ncbi:hypothetical protein [Mycoplasma zalophi]|uniref:Uncharacterized protein n=1 Tax=Mycoplasma zalophi TaxID=191287 RepID=A0ABS6DPT4_9MOLU|nr:hypothetical protein [Mycoplasma zalophi]MBU4690957.1 hypothetical protein [Mycoplasma zalophi]MBU4692263.1 hypothetical protein [Mycoplasma zalophi]